jgi:uncharacterized protein YegP (UPF0339 family)
MSTWRFRIGRDREGRYRWHLANPSGTRVVSSSEGYATEEDAVRAARHVREQIAAAELTADR